MFNIALLSTELPWVNNNGHTNTYSTVRLQWSHKFGHYGHTVTLYSMACVMNTRVKTQATRNMETTKDSHNI